MSKQQLLEYLQHVILLESAIAKYKNSISMIDEEKSCLGHAVKIKAPILPFIKKEKFRAQFTWYTLYLILPLAGIIYLITAMLEADFQSAFYPAAFIMAGFFVFVDILRWIAFKTKNGQKMYEYSTAVQQEENAYRAAVEADRTRVSKEQDIAVSLTKSTDNQAASIQRLQHVLDSLYSQNIIYPDFRGLIPVTYLYKYLASGITDRLEGPDGAYSQYLQDERTNRIIHKLDEVLHTLNMILNNQATQIGILRGMDESLHKIEQGLDTLNAKMTLMNSYVSGINEKLVSVNEYNREISSKLSKISENINVTAIHTAVMALNDYRGKIEAGVNAYYLRYPTYS